jgi:hypothetical protein
VLRNNAATVAASLPENWARTAFERFTEQLIASAPLAKVTWRTRLRRYGQWFEALGQNFASSANLTPERLSRVFGTEEIRRQQLPYTWLVENGFVEPIEWRKSAEESERKTRERLMARVPAGWKLTLLKRYQAYLERMMQTWRERGWSDEHERFQDRTVTLLLRAAKRFVEDLPEAVVSTQGIDQEQLHRFMTTFPGHVRALHSFVGYLNTKEPMFQKLELKSPRPPQGRAVERILTGERTRELTQKWLNATEKDRPVALMCLFMLIYARNARQAASLRRKDFEVLRSGVVRARFGTTPIPLAPEISAMLLAHFAEREQMLGRTLNDEEFVFPSRLPDRPYTGAALQYHLVKAGVTARQLYATSLASFFAEGLETPKVLVQALGISDPTALEYYMTVAPRVVDEMAQREGRR